MNNQNRTQKLVVLADGQGTLFDFILKSCQGNINQTGFMQGATLEKDLSSGHMLNAEVVALVTSKPQAPVGQKAQKAKKPFHVLPLEKFPSFADWDQALCSCLCQISPSPDWILLAGFLKKVGPRTLAVFKNRMINIHPSLLPRYGGRGMYGLHVHRAVIKAGDKKTGISIHLLSAEYDQGPLLAQKEIPVSFQDTPESLQKKVKKEEGAFYVATLHKIFNEGLF